MTFSSLHWKVQYIPFELWELQIHDEREGLSKWWVIRGKKWTMLPLVSEARWWLRETDSHLFSHHRLVGSFGFTFTRIPCCLNWKMISLDERQPGKWWYILLFRMNIIYFPLFFNYQMVSVKGKTRPKPLVLSHMSHSLKCNLFCNWCTFSLIMF